MTAARSSAGKNTLTLERNIAGALACPVRTAVTIERPPIERVPVHDRKVTPFASSIVLKNRIHENTRARLRLNGT
jgi:hypothetical protein